MKPTKNRVFCKDCDRIKMLFETEKKAETFMCFNREEIETESGYGPQRSYYCVFCGGWHITSRPVQACLSKKEQIVEQYIQRKGRRKAVKAGEQEKEIARHNEGIKKQEKRAGMMEDLKRQLIGLAPLQMETFFEENIALHKKGIELLLNCESTDEVEKLKELRLNLELLYIVRKQTGFKKCRLEEAREKEIEEWRLWAERISR